MTKITSKQFKVIDTVDFNNNAIENALINAMDNTITGLQTSDIENLDINLEGIANEISGLSNSIADLQPQVVANSGSSLPSVSGYSFGDKFLNTTDKKLYTVTNTYDWSSNVYHSSGIVFDSITGIASGFKTGRYLSKNYTDGWVGNNNFSVKFKLDTVSSGGLISIAQREDISSPNNINVTFGIYTDNKIYYSKYSSNGPSFVEIENKLLFDIELSANVEYILNINKQGNTCNVELLENDITIATNSFNTEDLTQYTLNAMAYSNFYINGNNYSLTTGSIYLLESSGDFLTSSSTIAWDNGTTLENAKEYVDITNSIIYYYINGVLFSSINSFAQITGQPTDNNALNIVLSGITNTLLIKQDILVSGTNIKNINNTSILGSGNLAVTTYQSFPNSWPTNTTFTALIDAIKNDITAVKGMAYLGELTCSGLPTDLINVEAVIEIMDGTTAQNKVIHTILTSSNVEPYRWEYTYWSGNQQVNWIGFDYNREIKTLNTTTPTTNVYLDANNTYTLNCSDQVTGLTISLLEPDNESINNSILLHSYIGLTNIQISWGTDKFFNNETPTIDSIGYYDIVYVWNNLLNKYVCNVTFISEN